ncbi:MAG TPA: hypothetical protein VFD23_01735, partial [Clostridia bacterium]|nr:hypothetical protein [Clostridia bacterium]
IILKARQQAEENTNTLVSQTKEGTDEIDKVATDAAKAEGATIVADARKKQAEAVKVMRSYLLPNFII